MFTKVSDLIRETSLLGSHNVIQLNVLAQQAWEYIRISPPELKSNIKIKHIRNNIIYFTASSGIWAQEMQLQKMDIEKKINTYLKKQSSKETIKGIVIMAASE